MDIFNDLYPLYPDNPDQLLSEQEQLEAQHLSKKRKKQLTFDDYCAIYSDDIWHLWCLIQDFTKNNSLLDTLDFPTFCVMCYENCSKY
jgi:hypothetical protein